MQPNNYGPSGTTTGENNTESTQRAPRNFTIPQPIAEEEQQQSQHEPAGGESDAKVSPAAEFIDSMKRFFAPCVGAVDAASLFIGRCRPSNFDTYEINKQQGDNIAEEVIMRLRERNGGFTQQTVKRRSETLEIPTHGMLFDDDDVSAISSYTLEEMERLRISQNRRLSNFHMSPNKNYSNYRSNTKSIMRPRPAAKSAGQQAASHIAFTNRQLWNIQHPPVTTKTTYANNNWDLSICVSESESSGSEGIETGKEEVARVCTGAPAWGNKAGKDKRFETHRVG